VTAEKDGRRTATRTSLALDGARLTLTLPN
jgi:hypothetical protein